MHGPGALGVDLAADHDRVTLDGDRDVGVDGPRHLAAFAPSTLTEPGATLTFTPFGILTGNLPMRDTPSPFYQIVQISSPPAFFSRALRPVVTPTEVVTMRVPKPLNTRGSVL